MTTKNDYRDYILDQVVLLGSIKCKMGLGECLLYRKGILFGGIYGDKLLVKMTPTNKKYNLPISSNTSAHPMYFIEDVDDIDYLEEIIAETCRGI